MNVMNAVGQGSVSVYRQFILCGMLVNVDNIWIKFEGGHRSKFTFTGGNKYSTSAGLANRGVVRGPKI